MLLTAHKTTSLSREKKKSIEIDNLTPEIKEDKINNGIIKVIEVIPVETIKKKSGDN